MPEVSIGFPRAFAEFVDPADPDQVFRCDLTWLTSRWSCIFGRGCPGSTPTARTTGAAPWVPTSPTGTTSGGSAGRYGSSPRRNGSTARAARRGGWVELEDPDHVAEGERPDRKTRIVDGACIFLNRPGFPAGEGCALHLLALDQGRDLTETKPDVCWQLPIRRQYRTVTRSDETSYTEVSIGEYGRDGWGPGGADLDWYCSANTEAHHGSSPVYANYRAELTALMGAAAYAVLVDLCAEFESRRGRRLRHPADPARTPSVKSR